MSTDETELEPYREAYKLNISPVMEPAAKRVAECYCALQKAKENSASHVASAQIEPLENEFHFAKESLFYAARNYNRGLFPKIETYSSFKNHLGHTFDLVPPAIAGSEKHLERLQGERQLKPLLNDYVANIAKQNNLATPPNNSYFAVNQLSY